MNENLDQLRQVAERATPGPWECVEGDEAFGLGAPVGCLTWDDHSGEVFKKEDAEHVATFDPPTVLALIERVESAEAAVQRVRELATVAQSWASQVNMSRVRTLSGDILRVLDGGEQG